MSKAREAKTKAVKAKKAKAKPRARSRQTAALYACEELRQIRYAIDHLAAELHELNRLVRTKGGEDVGG